MTIGMLTLKVMVLVGYHRSYAWDNPVFGELVRIGGWIWVICGLFFVETVTFYVTNFSFRKGLKNLFSELVSQDFLKYTN